MLADSKGDVFCFNMQYLFEWYAADQKFLQALSTGFPTYKVLTHLQASKKSVSSTDSSASRWYHLKKRMMQIWHHLQTAPLHGAPYQSHIQSLPLQQHNHSTVKHQYVPNTHQ